MKNIYIPIITDYFAEYQIIPPMLNVSTYWVHAFQVQ